MIQRGNSSARGNGGLDIRIVMYREGVEFSLVGISTKLN
jgi:hypothetical protein